MSPRKARKRHIWAYCAECGLAQAHKFSCRLGRGDYAPGRRLPRRDPGRSIRRPDRAYKRGGWIRRRLEVWWNLEAVLPDWHPDKWLDRFEERDRGRAEARAANRDQPYPPVV